MPWYFPWSDSIKKRACRYLLQHYVGQFLQEKLSLEQLSVDLFNGKGIVKDLPLDVSTLNELLEGANIPLEILDGFIKTIAISVPWSSLMQDNCELEVKGIEITVGILKKNFDCACSVTSEALSFSSMTTSLQLAQECLKNDESEQEQATSQAFEGLESFAETIESVLSRIKVSFEDVMIRFEHLFPNKKSGVGLELHLKRVDYSDLSSDNSQTDQPNDVFELPSVAEKHLRVSGLEISLDEFHESSRTLLRNTLEQRSPSPESIPSSPPLSPYQSAVFTQSLVTKQNISPQLLPPVVILSSACEQEARLKWKLNSSCPGPKVDFEYFLGTLNIFVSPKQLHLLTELMNEIDSCLQNTDDCNFPNSQDTFNRPMRPEHFHKIEQVLHDQMLNQHKQQNVQPKIDLWNVCFENGPMQPRSLTFDKNDDSDLEEEKFYSLGEDDLTPSSEPPVHGFHNTPGLVQRVSEAGIVPLNIPVEARNGHSLAKLSFPPNPGLAGITGLDDGANGTTKCLFRLSGLSVTILLKDPVQPLESSVSQNHPLCKTADRFFDGVSRAAFGSKDLEEIQEKFNKACEENHLRCFFATVSISCELFSTSCSQTVNAEATVGVIKIVECLIGNNDGKTEHRLTQLLKFSEKEEHSLGNYTKISPCFKAKYKSIQRSSFPASIQGRQSVLPRKEVDITLGNVDVLLDITLIERLHDIFCPSSDSCDSERSQPDYFSSDAGVRTDINQQALFSRTMTDGSSCEQKTQIQISCPNILASLTFPVPDVRKSSARQIDGKRWKKNLRKERCLIKCSDVVFETNLQDGEEVTSYEMRFRDLKGSLQLNDEDTPIDFVHVTKRHTENDSESNGFDLPRIVVHVQHFVSGPVLEEENSGDTSPDSLCDTYAILNTEPSPFSSKPVMYDKEELVVPGDPSEMKAFQEKASMSSKLHVELNFPEVDVNFHQQSFFELIYNRFGNDLLLWEPFDYSVVSNPDYDVSVSNMIGVDLPAQLVKSKFAPDQFQMCHSSMNNDSYSSDEDDDYNTDSFKKSEPLHTTEKTPRSTLALTLNTSTMRIIMFPATLHAEDSEESDFSKLLLRFDNAQLFYVLDYKGELNLCYTSVLANHCSLHQALSVNLVSSDMETGFEVGDLYRTIYESDSGVKVAESKSNINETRPMLLLAVKSYLDLERNAKDFVVALSLTGATLRHRAVHEEQMWLMQMMDFFCVTDEDVLGYIPPVVVTMLHVHFWNIALHYRPLYIPYQLVITAEGFSICSNITTDAKTSILRFIIDNAVLLISNKGEETTDLMKDYVSVADVDLFELSLSTVTDPEMNSPRLSLTLSNNIVHLRSCSDSLTAVLDLLRYIAGDGDFQREATTQSTNLPSDDNKEEFFDDTPVEQRDEKVDSLHDLMSEAMAESGPSSTTSTNESSQELTSPHPLKHDVFVFPNDSTSTRDSYEGDIPKPTSTDHQSLDDDDDLSDGEFCILEHPQKEQEVIYDEPKVKTFCEEIKIVPDHFSVPVGGVDLLKAPSDYPTPLYCYTIKEMSVVWQLYGGKDFNENKPKKREGLSWNDGAENVMLTDDDIDDDPVVINSRGGNIKRKPSQPRVGWKTNPGVSRDMNTLVEIQLTKVRFQYEKYPEDKTQVSRQVLLIQDIEVRDRLSSSQINKLLYQYSTEARPKQTHANMVSVKMLGLRPDLQLSSQEGCLKISLKPIRLNIDQDTLQFLINFCKDLSNADEISNPELSPENDLSIPVSQPELSTPNSVEPTPTNIPPTFFRLFEFSPEVPIRLDYHGKHMDMGQGTIAGLLFAFGQLNCSEIKLRRLCQRNGLLGIDRVMSYALNEWANDIKKTQIPGILGGVGPTYSFVQLVQGVKDLFWLPVEQYRRDGRIMRGLQRGASSFTTSSAMAFLELTNKLVQVVHGAAEVAYDMVSPETATNPRGQAIKRRVPLQPVDFRQGMANAYSVVTEGFGKTACNIVQAAKEEHENRGMTGAVGGVLRHIPSAVVQPIILATEATSNVLGGVRNQILPDARREATEKWRLNET